MAEKVNFASVVSNRGFRSLWFNQILVQLAYNTLNFALIIWVFKLTDSNLAVATLMLCVYLPSIAFGMFAGVFVDITDRKKIILLIDVLLALSFLLFIFIKGAFVLILINTFLINTLAQFFMPSESSSIPLLVSRKQLFLANSLFSLTLYAAFMTGYSIGGPILNHVGINAVFIGGAVLLLLAFILAQSLPAIKVSSRGNKFDNFISFKNLQKVITLTLSEGKQTLEFVRGKIGVGAAILLMAGVQGIVGMLAVIMPSYLERVLLIHATDASYFVMLPLGLGMVSGALLVGRLFHGWPRRSIVIPAMVIAGCLFILGGVVPLLAQFFQSAELPIQLTRPRYFVRAPSLSSFFAVIAFMIGFCNASIIIPCQTALQESTSDKNRGKIFATLGVAMTAFSALPVILAGILSDLFGVIPIIIGIGVVILLAGLVAKNPSYFFEEHHLPYKVRVFLGLGHWKEYVH